MGVLDTFSLKGKVALCTGGSGEGGDDLAAIETCAAGAEGNFALQ